MLRKSDDFHTGHALGLLIISAIEHLVQQKFCCRECCPACMGLDLYRDQEPDVADACTNLVLNGQQRDWQLDDGAVNWPYLVQIWMAPTGGHRCT